MSSKIGEGSHTESFDHAAYYLMNQGAFNINSTSVEAWRAFFSSLNRMKRPASSEGSSAVLAVYSSLLIPASDVKPLQTNGDNGAWNGMNPLTPESIDQLAEKMVEVIKIRGPFLGLADFVNRRLETKVSTSAWVSDDPSLMGPLQAAIEKVSESGGGLNQKLTEQPDGVINPKLSVTGYNTNTPYKYKHYGASSMLNQADFLQALAPSMTARGDTFVIRCYGESTNANTGKVMAKAWCEATVQRIPDYILANEISKPSDGNGNNPMEPITVRSTSENQWSLNDSGQGGMLPINQKFGRKIVVTQFRWLNPSEI